MKRYFCTAAAGLLLALGSTGTASATGLPVVGGTQEATQSASRRTTPTSRRSKAATT